MATQEGPELITYLQKRFASLWQKLAGDPDAEERDFFLEEYLRDLEERAYLETTIANQYRGRYLIELVQNAVDAMQRQAETSEELPPEEENPAYRCLILLTPQALYVANDGQPFGPEDVRGLTAMGKSTKGVGRYIGYKGLGFRAVMEISDAPEVYSGPYRFGFSRAETLALLQKGTSGVEIGDVPALSVPFPRDPATLPAEEQATLSSILGEREYATVIRLPLKPGLYGEVAALCRDFSQGQSLLFLPHITLLTLELPGEVPAILSKTRQPLPVPPAFKTEVQFERVRLELQPEGKHEDWLLVAPPVPLPVPRDLLQSLNDRTWARVETASLALALPVLSLPGGDVFFKRRLDPLPFFTHFPTKEIGGAGFAVHADFYLSAARTEIDPELPYNRWLSRQAVNFLCSLALPSLQARYPDDAALLDLLSDIPYHSGAFGHAFRQILDEQLAATAFVPVGAGQYRKPHQAAWTPLTGAGVLLFRKVFPQPPGELAYPVLQLEETYIAEEEGFEYRRVRRFLRELGMRPVEPSTLPELWPQALKGWYNGAVNTAEICATLALWYEQLAKGTFTPEERQRALVQEARGLPVLPVGREWVKPGGELYDWPATGRGFEALKARQLFFAPVQTIREDAYSPELAEFEPQVRAWHKRLGLKSLDPEEPSGFDF